jgi:hypothetical protein
MGMGGAGVDIFVALQHPTVLSTQCSDHLALLLHPIHPPIHLAEAALLPVVDSVDLVVLPPVPPRVFLANLHLKQHPLPRLPVDLVVDLLEPLVESVGQL